MHHIKICTFKGTQNLPLYVAQQQGFFEEQNLRIDISYTVGSLPQLAGLIRGEYQLIQTAPDNVINVDNNPAAFGLDPAMHPHVVMFLGGSVGPLSIFAQKDITSFDRLRGAVLGVDNPTSGFAIVLRDILAQNSLLLERDYTFTIAGGTSDRLGALASGSVAATILYAPFDVLASSAGYNRLATSTDYYPAYASLATAGTRTWIKQHTEEVSSYIAAYRESFHWIYDPAHADATQAIMQKEPSLNLDASLAPYVYAAFIDAKTGFGQEALLDEMGLEQVITLRAASSSTPMIKDLAYYLNQ